VTKRLQTIKTTMLADRKVRDTYDALAGEFDLARELIAARVRAGLTQAELAERMGTTQSVVKLSTRSDSWVRSLGVRFE
jgi:ribosome-binding protein aMBF1 (putative translation factor)